MDYALVASLLGRLAMGLAVTMVLPLVVACLHDVGQVENYVIAELVTCFLAGGLWLYGRGVHRHRLRLREAIAVTVLGWLVVCILGALPYCLSGILSPLAALFESVSGFTTTGVTTLAYYGELPLSLMLWRCMTHWCGGLGIIMLFVVLMPQVSNGTGYLFNAELPDALGKRSTAMIKKAAFLITAIYTGLTVLELLLLMGLGMEGWAALNLALSTMSTGGFPFNKDSLITYNSWAIELVVLVFMLLASLNFSLYYKIYKGDWASLRNNREHIYYVRFLAIIGLLLSADLFWRSDYSFLEAVRHGFFQTVSIGSTTGLATTNFSAWSSFSLYLLFILMFIGGCGGSTAGGMKVSRFVILLKATWAELLRILHPRIVYAVKLGKQPVAPALVGHITRFFFLYFLVILILTILLALDGTRAMYDYMGMILACVSSAGPAYAIVGGTAGFAEVSAYGRCICIIAMLLGRLEIFAVLAILRPSFWQDKEKSW